MLLLKHAAASDSSTTAGSRQHSKQPTSMRAHGSHRSSIKQQRGKLLWLCCASQPAVSDEDQRSSLSDSSTVPAPAGTPVQSMQPVLPAKDTASQRVGSLSMAVRQQQQQQTILVTTTTPTGSSGSHSPKPGTTPPTPDMLTNSMPWHHQQGLPRLGAEVAPLALDQGCAGSDRAGVAQADGQAVARSASLSLVPLTRDSLATAPAVFGSFTAGQSVTRPTGPQASQESPSEIHSDPQNATNPFYSSSSSASSGQRPQSTGSTQDASHSTPHQQQQQQGASLLASLPASLASAQQQQQQQELLLPPEEQHIQALQQQHNMAADGLGALAPVAAAALIAKHSSTVGVSTAGSSCQATTSSSIAGWSEVLSPAAAAAAAAASATASTGAATADLGNSATSSSDATAVAVAVPAAATAATADDDEVLPLPEGLTDKLRKLESGLSFRMLEPEISDSLQASGSFTATASGSDGATAGILSDSGSANGPVSRCSTGFVPLGRQSPTSALGQLQGLSLAQNPNRASSAAEERSLNPAAAVPATIPEHVSISNASGLVATTSEAVAAAFESDAAAVKDLVKAAAALPPRPHHSRSRSAGAFDTTAIQPSAAGTTVAATGQQPPAVVLSDAAAQAVAEVASSGLLGSAAATAANSKLTAAGSDARVQPTAIKQVTRTLSVASSPFAKMDLQQMVTATLLAKQQQQQQHMPPLPPVPAAAAAPTAMTPVRPGSRVSSSSSYRSMRHDPYSLHPQLLQSQLLQSQLQLQHTGGGSASHSQGAVPTFSAAVPTKTRLRPSLTSKLSWASTVTLTEPQAPRTQVFALLSPQGTTASLPVTKSVTNSVSNSVTEVPEEGEGVSATRILRPSKSFVASSKQQKGPLQGSKSFSSLSPFGRADSGTSSGSSTGSSSSSGTNKKGGNGPGLFSFATVRSAAALFSRQTSAEGQCQPRKAATAAANTTAAAAASAGVGIPTSDTAGTSSNSSNSSSNSSRSPQHSTLHKMTSSSSLGQISSSGSGSGSSGTGGSLMSLAVTRMHSAAASCSSIAATAASTAADGSAALASQRSSSMPDMGAGSAPIPRQNKPNSSNSSSSSRSSIDVAKAFADAFLAALCAGNVKWASEPTLADLLAESAKMVALDKQLYVGKAAIIRRLNGGMDQLVKMAQATATDSSSSSTGADSAAAAAAAATESVAALAKRLPKPQLTVTCPDPKGRPSQVEAVYTFKWGIRKFTMKDEFIVREGQILRLRRTRG